MRRRPRGAPRGSRRRPRRAPAPQHLAASAEHYRALVENLPQTSVAILDPDLRFRVVAGPSLAASTLRREEIEGRLLDEVVPPAQLGPLRDRYLEALEGRRISFEYRSARDGRAYWLQVVPLQEDGEQITGIMAVSLDVTERVEIEDALRESEERFRKSFDEAPIGMALLGIDGRFEQVNAALCDITGYPEHELVARPLASIAHPEDAVTQVAELHRLVEGAGENHRDEMRILHSGGHTVTVALHVAPLRGASGEAEHLLVQIQDITDRKRFEDQLQFMVDHDPLTGLLNRRGFERELERHISHVSRYGPDGALLVLDLDHFKLINDTLGHNAGDELISRITTVLRARLRTNDVLARLGGDEFAVLLPRAGDEQAAVVARALLAGVREQEILLAAERPSDITASIGVAVFDEADLTAEEMLIRADLAMYDAKEAGRDRLVFYAGAGQTEPRMRARLTWVDRIRAALREDRLVLYAQPIVSLVPERPSMYELLLRMRGDDGDLIPPSTFLYVAERFDLVQEIDRWVARRSIALLERAIAAGPGVPLTVNVSARSLGDVRLLELVEEELARSGVPPELLIFEITETAAITNIQPARRFAEHLRELGCGLALDDFGSGFASFYHLKHLPFDFLKIDGEFVSGCLSSRTDQLLIEAVVAIAKGLGKRTIAELTPDAATLAFLRSRGVDFTQSYLTGAPVPIERTGLLRAGRAPDGEPLLRPLDRGPGALTLNGG